MVCKMTINLLVELVVAEKHGIFHVAEPLIILSVWADKGRNMLGSLGILNLQRSTYYILYLGQ